MNTECHFWANVMLRQPRVWTSKSCLAQTSQGLRVVYSKNFSRTTFFLFSGSLGLRINIWTICPWNKFEEEAQCEFELKIQKQDIWLWQILQQYFCSFGLHSKVWYEVSIRRLPFKPQFCELEMCKFFTRKFIQFTQRQSIVINLLRRPCDWKIS